MNQSIPNFNDCTYSTRVAHESFIKIDSTEKLSAVIEDLMQQNKEFHICSTGMNWGYGSKLGDKSGTVLIDVSSLKKIELNEEHGYVVIEAGVTQQDLYDYLSASESSLILSITGSSPNSSIIGNALSYGYGNGRSTLRVEDILQVNGFDKQGKHHIGIDNSTCKYGNHSTNNKLIHDSKSIITKAKISLKQIPETLLLTAFSIDSDDKFEQLIKKLNHYKNQGLIEGNWSVFSAHRLLAEKDSKKNLFSDVDKQVEYEIAKNKLEDFGYKIWKGSYNGVFACYLPSKGIADSIQNFLEENFSKAVDGIEFIQVSKKNIMDERKNGNGFNSIITDPPILSRLRTFSGILKNGSVDIMYWKKNIESKQYLPDVEKCGFIWLANSLPNDSKLITQFKTKVNSTLSNYNIDPIFVIDGVL
ncbi:MAG: FAD-binding protein, partial [Flavobacteriales bacterium]